MDNLYIKKLRSWTKSLISLTACFKKSTKMFFVVFVPDCHVNGTAELSVLFDNTRNLCLAPTFLSLIFNFADAN